jgi:hypothetical protein
MPLPTMTAPPLTVPPLSISMRLLAPLAMNVPELTTVPVTIALPPESIVSVALAATGATVEVGSGFTLNGNAFSAGITWKVLSGGVASGGGILSGGSFPAAREARLPSAAAAS